MAGAFFVYGLLKIEFQYFSVVNSTKIRVFSIFQGGRNDNELGNIVNLRNQLKILLDMNKGRKENDESCLTLCDRSIWYFYKWGVVLAPLALMLSHWYVFYQFSQNTHELMHYSKENEICIAWIYSILYLYVPIMLLPASFFFKRCFLFQIPFIYFMFINMERWQYDSWFCTNEMVETHKVLIKCIIGLYAFDIFRRFLENLSNIVRIGKNLIAFTYAWVKSKLHKEEKEELI